MNEEAWLTIINAWYLILGLLAVGVGIIIVSQKAAKKTKRS